MRKWWGKAINLTGARGEQIAGQGGEKLIYLVPESSFLQVPVVKELNILVIISGTRPGREMRGRGRARWLKSRNHPPLK
jgi:hypothetical protein